MPDIINSENGGVYGQIGPVPQKPRYRHGQLRAPKRTMIEQRRGPHRTRRALRGDGNSGSILECTHKMERKSTNIPVSYCASFDTSPESSPNSQIHSQGLQIDMSTEHKRPRPELHTPRSDISLSAPACCMRDENSPILFVDKSTDGSKARFTCEHSLINPERMQGLLDREFGYHPNIAFLYYVNPGVEDKVDAVLRNEAVHNLRFVHNTFFNLPTETFCKAVNLIDRFIVKVKVKPKYMACVATASYCVASKYSCANKVSYLPAPDTVVHITRCGGNAVDLVRMEEILSSKLSHDLDGVNAFDFLRLFTDAIVPTPDHTGRSSDNPPLTTATPGDLGTMAGVVPTEASFPSALKTQRTQLIKRLMTRLEIVFCSLEAYRFRPACLALGILLQVGSVGGLVPLATACGIDWSDVIECAALVGELYEIYYRDPLPCNRRSLVWNLSHRTLFRIGYSSPTPLDTITEDCEPVDEEEWLLPLLFEP